MKSIYSLEVVQRIIDHWSIGQIEGMTYFSNPGSSIWRHHIETNQGTFELYSYPPADREYAESKLSTFLREKLAVNPQVLKKRELVHSFDRYHQLLQLTKKHQISSKQATKDIELLLGSTIEKAFRVYGTIFQLHLNEAGVNRATVLVSYGWWSVHVYQKGRGEDVLADSRIHSKDKLDAAIERVVKEKPSVKKYILKGGWFELYLSNGMSLHFVSTGPFAAAELHIKSRKNNLVIFGESALFYTRDARDK